MNIKEIKEMINLMNENGLNELEIEKEGMRIKLKKGPSGELMMEELKNKIPMASAPVHNSTPQPQTVPQAPQPKETASDKQKSSKAVEVTAPMVGTFYRAPSPESPPFAEINQVIEVGQVLCILEAMKLMNEIKSDIKGKIIDILVDNAEPVEFGQPLFLIEPA